MLFGKLSGLPKASPKLRTFGHWSPLVKYARCVKITPVYSPLCVTEVSPFFATLVINIVAAGKMRDSLKTAKETPDNGGKGLVRETLNAIRLLTRLTPLLYEDPEWIGFFHSKIPAGDGDGIEAKTLAEDVIEVIFDV